MTRVAGVTTALKPLVSMCKTGKLFEIQEWIRRGEPIILPSDADSRARRSNPLRVAMSTGFHSVVQVLLEAGAPLRHGGYSALRDAVEQQRPDLASLLLDHGAGVDDVSMQLVIEMWHPEMVELFVARGASLTDGSPIAWGLMHRVRPTLGLLKRLAPERPELMRQAELALRFHAREGHAQGVALLMWAGADPWARGPDSADDQGDDEEEADHLNAVELALIHGHLEVFNKPKALLERANISDEDARRLLETACFSDGQALPLLLSRGHNPAELPERGTRAIGSLLHTMTWDLSSSRPPFRSLSAMRAPGIDTTRSRKRMKLLHLLIAGGARWLPADKAAIAEVRRSLLKMARPYALEGS